MSGILRVEARHLARSPLLWLGFALAAWATGPELWRFWPALPGDDLLAYRSGFLGAAGAVWAGAWLGLRDRVSGAADLVTVTPTAPWRLWRARLAGVAVVTAGAFALLFAGALAISAARGGRGTPDLRLLADGALAVALSGLVGVAVGRLSGSRVVALLAGPLWSLLCMGVADPGNPWYRLSPFLPQEERASAEFGFLPDFLWPHLGYLLGLVLLAGVLLVAAGGGSRRALVPMLVVAVAGLVLVGAGGTRLVALPRTLVVLGPDRADWKTPAEAEAVFAADPSYAYPDDGRATSCARDATLSVCVYPTYGAALARRVHRDVGPVAGLLAGLPGTPARARMVPGYVDGCRDGEVQLGDLNLRVLRGSRVHAAQSYLGCALGQLGGLREPWSQPGGARDVVKLWALLASGTVSRQELEGAGESELLSFGLAGERPSAFVAPALAMAELPADRVRAELAPLWERLQAGALPVSELPGQRS
jgi:hypothetical protein